jgi:hypothetical protein
VFEKLPQLEALDGFDRDGSEWSLLDPNELANDEGDKGQNNEVILNDYYHNHVYLMRQDEDSDSSL